MGRLDKKAQHDLLHHLADLHPVAASLPASFGDALNREVLATLTTLKALGFVDFIIPKGRYGAAPLPQSIAITNRGLEYLRAEINQD